MYNNVSPFLQFVASNAVIRYSCAALRYDMHVGSLILELALVSSLLPLLQLVVPFMPVLWHCGRLFILSRKRSSVHGTNRKNSASVSVTRGREKNINS